MRGKALQIKNDGAAAFRIAAEMSADGMTTVRLDMWVANARPGASLVLGQGIYAGAAMSPEVRKRVMALAEAGLVHPVQKRVKADGGGFFYMVQRGARRVPVEFPLLPWVPRVQRVTVVGGRT